jgi:hypothetical protein
MDMILFLSTPRRAYTGNSGTPVCLSAGMSPDPFRQCAAFGPDGFRRIYHREKTENQCQAYAGIFKLYHKAGLADTAVIAVGDGIAVSVLKNKG